MKKYHIMLKIISVILCFFLLISCNSAKTNSDISDYLLDPKFDSKDALPQYDSDNSWAHRMAGDYACSTGDTIYFSLDNEYLGYSDLVTGVNGPLCGKPECMHNDAECNAHVVQAGGLSVYDGKLFWVDFDEKWNPAIYRMDLDGTNRVKVCSLDNSQYQKITGNLCIVFHRGYAIISGNIGIIVDGSVCYGVLAYAVSLSTGAETTIIERKVGEETKTAIAAIPYRNMLYLVCTESTNNQRQLDISSWNLKNHETTLLHSQTVDFPIREVWPIENGLLLSSAGSGNIHKFDLSANELTLLFNFCTSDEEGYRPDFANNYIIGMTQTKENLAHIRVTNLDGSEVYSEDLDLPNWPSQGYGYALLGADDGNLYVQLLSAKSGKLGKTRRRCEIAQIPLDGGGIVRELWSLEREY